MGSTDRGYVPQLDLLRALGVIIVMVSHLPPRIIPDGGPGVVLFFVLSGYLITTLLLRERHARQRIALGSFWARRGLRLVPALWSVVAASAVMLVIFRADYEPWAAAGGVRFEPVLWCVTALTWTTSLFSRAITPANPLAPTWSLSIEEQFYLVWPVVVIAASRLSRGTGEDESSQRRVAAVGLAALAGAIMAARALGPLPTADLFAWGRFDGILIGCAVGLIRYSTEAGPRPGHGSSPVTPAVSPAASPAVSPAVALGAGSCALGASIAVQFVSDTLAARTSDSLAVIGAVFLLLGALDSAPPTATSGGAAAAMWLGKRSYGVYLWHTPWVQLVALGTGWTRWFLVTPVALVGALVTAGASYRWLEQPFRNVQSRFRPY